MTQNNVAAYRDCVGLLLLNSKRRVWIGKRISKSTGQYANFSDYCWQMPQGGIDEGETPLEAAKRELKEETGLEQFKIIAESEHWYQYDLPNFSADRAFKGKFRGQRQKWFALQFTGKDTDDDLTPEDGHPAEFDDWRWEYGAKLPSLIVPFKRIVYQQVIEEFDQFLAKEPN